MIIHRLIMFCVFFFAICCSSNLHAQEKKLERL